MDDLTLKSEDPEAICEAYLDRISSGLAKDVSVFEREDIVKEIRAHLVACAAAFEELGLSPANAMNAAIKRFGDTAQIQKQLIKETRKGRPRSLAPLISVLMSAVIGSVLMTVSDYCIVLTHQVSNPSEGMPVIGAFIGTLIGLSIYRQSRMPLINGLRASVIVPTAMILMAIALNRRVPDYQFLLVCFIAFAVASFLIAFTSAWGIKLIKRDLAMPNKPPIVPG